MYDILQLNDMLVPELLDIAEQQSISNAKTLEKQELIYKILDKQAVMNNTEKKAADTEKPKRKRIIKSAPAASSAEETMATDEVKEMKPKKTEEKKKPSRKHKDDGQDDAENSGHTEKIIEELADPKSIAPSLVELLNDEDDEEIMEPPIGNYQREQKKLPA